MSEKYCSEKERMTMADYIKREEAIEASIDGADDYDVGHYGLSREFFIRAAINDVDAADVVEVVRCRDCKYWNANLKQCFHKTAPGMWREETFFCANGERKTKTNG